MRERTGAWNDQAIDSRNPGALIVTERARKYTTNVQAIGKIAARYGSKGSMAEVISINAERSRFSGCQESRHSETPNPLRGQSDGHEPVACGNSSRDQATLTTLTAWLWRAPETENVRKMWNEIEKLSGQMKPNETRTKNLNKFGMTYIR